MDSTTFDIFLIHAGPDTAIAEKLYDLLSSSHRVFLDSKCLQPGDVWPDILQHVTKNARMSVILVSRDTGPAFYEQSEIASAIQCFRASKRRCVPVYVGGKPGKEIEFPYGLNIIQGIEADPSNLLPVATKLRELLPVPPALPPQPVIRIISTDPDLRDARQRVAEYMKTALGISADATPVDPEAPLTGIDLLVLLQGFWWDAGRVANAWRNAKAIRRLAFVSDPEADWPPRRLSEHREENDINGFRCELRDAALFRDPGQLLELVGAAIADVVAEMQKHAGDRQRTLSKAERTYLQMRWTGWRDGRSMEGSRHHIDVAGAPETYRSDQYVAVLGRADSWGEDAAGNIVSIRSGKKMDLNKLKSDLPLARWISARPFRHLALVGIPGAGKTIFLTRAAAALACIHLGRPERFEPELNFDALRNDDGYLPIPVLLEATRLVRRSAPDLRGLIAALSKEIDPAGQQGPPEQDVVANLEDGRYMLLIDALDEVWSSNQRSALLGILKAVASAYPQTRIVVTTRSATYTGNLGLGPEFETVVLRELTDNQQREFCRRWAEIHNRGSEYLGRLYDVLRALSSVDSSAGDGSLTGTPLLLTAVCMIFEKHGSLPDDRGQLCAVLIDDLCRSRQSYDEVRGWKLDAETKRQLLERIALAMQDEGRQSWPTNRATGEIAEVIGNSEGLPDRCLNWLAEHTGLIRFQDSDTGESIRFWHRLFREYLTSSSLANRDCAASDLVALLFRTQRLRDPAWTDIIRLLPRALGSTTKVDALWNAFVALAERETESAGRILGLAQSIVIESRGLFRNLNTKTQARWLAAEYERLGRNWSFDDRSFFLDALGRFDPDIGDPRLEHERWVFVPGEAALAGDILHHAPTHPGSVARRQQKLPPFMISWAPVTYQDLAEYADPANKDARKQHYSTPQPREGTRDPENVVRLTEHKKGRLRNWPVIGFDLFDALAYCSWRTVQRSDGRTVRLPTEAEWEASVWHGLTEQEWLACGQMTNIRVAPVRSTLATSLERPTDMFGNVQQWCDTKFERDDPSGDNPSSNSSDGHPMVVRGGSLGVIGRRYQYMVDTDQTLGFRLVLIPPL